MRLIFGNRLVKPWVVFQIVQCNLLLLNLYDIIDAFIIKKYSFVIEFAYIAIDVSANLQAIEMLCAMCY